MNKYYVILTISPSSGARHLDPSNEVVFRDYSEALAVCERWNRWAESTLPAGYGYTIIEVEHDD